MDFSSPSSGSSTSSPHSRPQTVSEVLCREVGAAHPDGALKQIRTMKRLLRSHYVAQRRLERYGVSGVSEALETIEALRTEVRRLKAERRNAARAAAHDLRDALDAVDRLTAWLHEHRQRIAELEAQLDAAPLDAAQPSDAESPAESNVDP